MNNTVKKELLRPDLEIQNVYAHMESGYVDRKNTIFSDKRTVDILVHEQSDLLLSHKSLFIDFLDPKSEYIDRYRKLPREVRDYMGKFAVNGKFMVRKDIIDKVFGFKVYDLSQLKLLQYPSMARVKRYAGLLHYLIRQTVGYGKDRIVIAMPAVVFGNMVSNIAQLTMKKIPISYTSHKILEGFHEYQRYQKDSDDLRILKNTIASRKLPNTDPLAIKQAGELLSLNTRIENNKIHRLSVAGVNSLIVEDINDAAIDGYFNKLKRTLKVDTRFAKHAEKIPTSLTNVASWMFMTKTSKPYQVSRQLVQLNDFLARYVMIEYATEVKGIPFKVALHDAINAFVLFDETLTPVMEFLDTIGVTSFISYFLRNQRASRVMVQTNPTAVGISAAVQYATGIPTLGNINASVFGGDFSPNLMQLDDLFDEANNMTGAGLLADAYNGLFS